MVILAIDIVVIYFCSFKYIKKYIEFNQETIYVNTLFIFIVLRKPSNTINIIFNFSNISKIFGRSHIQETVYKKSLGRTFFNKRKN